MSLCARDKWLATTPRAAVLLADNQPSHRAPQEESSAVRPRSPPSPEVDFSVPSAPNRLHRPEDCLEVVVVASAHQLVEWQVVPLEDSSVVLLHNRQAAYSGPPLHNQLPVVSSDNQHKEEGFLVVVNLPLVEVCSAQVLHHNPKPVVFSEPVVVA